MSLGSLFFPDSACLRYWLLLSAVKRHCSLRLLILLPRTPGFIIKGLHRQTTKKFLAILASKATGHEKKKSPAQRGSFRDGYPAHIRWSLGWTSRIQTSVRASKPWKNMKVGADSHDFPKILCLQYGFFFYDWIYAPCLESNISSIVIIFSEFRGKSELFSSDNSKA